MKQHQSTIHRMKSPQFTEQNACNQPNLSKILWHFKFHSFFDAVNAVWVDETSSEYFDLVKVIGCTKAQEK